MKLLALVLGKKEEKVKTRADYQRENLIKFGRRQFQKMKELGVGAPIQLA